MQRPFAPLLLCALLSIASPKLGAFAADPAPASSAGAINTVCPVSGDKIGDVGKPVYADYHGKKIAFCCKDCVKKFQKNPDKYGSLAEKDQSAHEEM